MRMMDDFISRKEAIKAIENLHDCYNGFSDTYDKACIIGVLEEILPVTCYGYDIKDLIEFGIACKRAGVDKEDLKAFANNLDFAFKTLQAEIDGTFEHAIYEMIKRGIQNG